MNVECCWGGGACSGLAVPGCLRERQPLTRARRGPGIVAVYASTFHPDTGEKIFLPFRFSAWAPVNLAVVVGMLIPNQGVRVHHPFN